MRGKSFLVLTFTVLAWVGPEPKSGQAVILDELLNGESITVGNLSFENFCSFTSEVEGSGIIDPADPELIEVTGFMDGNEPGLIFEAPGPVPGGITSNFDQPQTTSFTYDVRVLSGYPFIAGASIEMLEFLPTVDTITIEETLTDPMDALLGTLTVFGTDMDEVELDSLSFPVRSTSSLRPPSRRPIDPPSSDSSSASPRFPSPPARSSSPLESSPWPATAPDAGAATAGEMLLRTAALPGRRGADVRWC